MVDYYLKNIDSETWKRFKAVCALRGLTVRDSLIVFIQIQSSKGEEIQKFVEAYDIDPKKEGEGL